MMEMDVMWNKKIELHRDKTYSSDFSDFGETGTFELGDNTITLKSDETNKRRAAHPMWVRRSLYGR
ncbi:hypothetical protein [Xylanibacter brevis]|uniref:hypothetical protein n=1 Tax=Xylanibacter brevis TaxID=83231 RepID=UPI00048352FB|nr:hypothetical protein [Xylanibacter brevis]